MFILLQNSFFLKFFFLFLSFPSLFNYLFLLWVKNIKDLITLEVPCREIPAPCSDYKPSHHKSKWKWSPSFFLFFLIIMKSNELFIFIIVDVKSNRVLSLLLLNRIIQFVKIFKKDFDDFIVLLLIFFRICNGCFGNLMVPCDQYAPRPRVLRPEGSRPRCPPWRTPWIDQSLHNTKY